MSRHIERRITLYSSLGQKWTQNSTHTDEWCSHLTPSSPSLIQALVFEKPNFGGECIEVDSDVYNLQEEPEEESTGKPDKKLVGVGSIKILGGL